MSVLTFFGMLLVSIVGLALLVFSGMMFGGGVMALVDSMRNKFDDKISEEIGCKCLK